MKIYKIANLYNSGDYGSWIVPSGKIYRVKEFQGHALALTFIMKSEKLTCSEDMCMGRGSEEEGFKFGFIRVSNNPIAFDCGYGPRMPITISQKEIMMNLIMEYRGTEVFINIKEFNKEDEMEEIEKEIEML